MLHAEIAKSYPLVPTDLAAEIAAEEKGIPDIPGVSPFGDNAARTSRWGARARKNLTIDTHARHQSVATSITSPGAHSDDTENLDDEKTYSNMAFTPHTGGAKRPNTSDSQGGIKKQFHAIVGRHNPEPYLPRRGHPGPPIYNGVRQKLDGWYLRSMRTLERSEYGTWFDGYDWQAQARDM